MDYKKKYLKYKKKYLESKNIIKNRITEEIKNNPNIKNKLKGGMSGDIVNWIVPIVLSALGVGAGYLGYKHFFGSIASDNESEALVGAQDLPTSASDSPEQPRYLNYVTKQKKKAEIARQEKNPSASPDLPIVPPPSPRTPPRVR